LPIYLPYKTPPSERHLWQAAQRRLLVFRRRWALSLSGLFGLSGLSSLSSGFGFPVLRPDRQDRPKDQRDRLCFRSFPRWLNPIVWQRSISWANVRSGPRSLHDNCETFKPLHLSTVQQLENVRRSPREDAAAAPHEMARDYHRGDNDRPCEADAASRPWPPVVPRPPLVRLD